MSGPNSALSPPNSTMTMASTERGIASDSGEMLPFENANRPPAIPANTPATTNPRQRMRATSIPSAAARNGESRTPRSARPNGECVIRLSAIAGDRDD